MFFRSYITVMYNPCFIRMLHKLYVVSKCCTTLVISKCTVVQLLLYHSDSAVQPLLYHSVVQPLLYDLFQVLTVIVFFSSFISVLYYLGVMQFLIRNIARFMAAVMGTSPAESLNAAGNIFIGQVWRHVTVVMKLQYGVCWHHVLYKFRKLLQKFKVLLFNAIGNTSTSVKITSIF